MTFGSVFAGIGGFDLGFERAGLASHWQIEIDAFCRLVLAKHWPNVRRLTDVRDTCGSLLRVSHANPRCAECGRTGWVPWADVICGGFPCQDVSIAGKRKGLAGKRSGLFFQFMRIVAELRPSWVVIENVDGLLSTHAGADFGIVLRELEDVGYVGAWRVLDSRWFGVPQRRNRVFIVGHRGTDNGRARSVLFESARRSWDSPSRQEAEAHVAATLRGRAHGVGVRPPGRGGEDDLNLIPLSIAGPLGGGNDGIGRRSEDDPNLVVYDTTQITSAVNRSNPKPGAPCHPLAATAHAPLLSHTLSSSSSTRTGRLDLNGETFIASALTESMGHRGYGSPRGDANDNLIAVTLGTSNGARQHLEQHYEVVGALGGNKERGGWRCGPDEVAANQAIESQGVRRLTPLECERLQGFPDGWTCLCGCLPYSTRACRCKDGARYRALGNAVTVPVIEWIGHRLLAAERRSKDAREEEVA